MAAKGARYPLPIAGYVRVSRVGSRDEDKLRSPSDQRKAIEALAEREGFTVEWFEDIDVSGSKPSRKGLDEIRSRIRNGELGGVAVAKLDRLSRMNPRDRIALVDFLKKHDARLLSASESLDPSTPEGRFQRELFMSLARMQWEKYKEGFDLAKKDAIDDGVAVGPTPYGYMRAPGKDGNPRGPLLPHPDEAEHLIEAFKLTASSGLSVAVEYLSKNAPGHRWTTTTVRRTLSMRVYLGEATYRRGIRDDEGNLLGYEDHLHNPTAHEPLVKRAEWEAAQANVKAPKRRKPAADYPLSGLAVCGTCGTHMVGAHAGKGVRTYRCARTTTTWRGERCPAPVTCQADRLEAYVIGAVRDALAGAALEVTGDAAGADLAALEAAMIEAEAELDEFAKDTKARKLLGERYHSAMEVRTTDVEEAQRAYREAAAAQAAATVTLPAAEAWDDMTAAELAEALRRALFAVEVAKGTGRGRHASPIAERVTFHTHDDTNVAAALTLADGSGQD